jgi:hypothetical protein
VPTLEGGVAALSLTGQDKGLQRHCGRGDRDASR